MEKKEKISVFDYTDYRRFLYAYYAERKSQDRRFCLEAFLERMGCPSKGFYQDLVKGRRNLKGRFIILFARSFGFSKKEAEYFEDLVHFTQSRTPEEKEHYYDRMLRSLNLKTYRMRSDQYAYYSKWYYSAIRELLFIHDISDDYAALARRLSPSVTAEQAREAVALMLRLKLVRRDPKGFLRPSDTLITTGPEINEETQRLHVRSFHQAMIQRAYASLAIHPPRTRDISGVSVSIDKETFEKIKSECVSFRKLVLNWAGRQKKPDRAYQLNIQFFPLSVLPPENEKTE